MALSLVVVIEFGGQSYYGKEVCREDCMYCMYVLRSGTGQDVCTMYTDRHDYWKYVCGYSCGPVVSATTAIHHLAPNATSHHVHHDEQCARLACLVPFGSAFGQLRGLHLFGTYVL